MGAGPETRTERRGTALPAYRFSVAPMMDCTDRHARFLLRLISRRALLYTEMVPAGAIVHGKATRFLAYDPAERPLAVQFGGSEPRELARCARLAEVFGYDEVNLNVGCPSDRVQAGRFGACLMAEPARVAECVAAMCAATALPVTVKCRIGIDDQDSEADLHRFVAAVTQAGCTRLIVHARKAWLQGLSPRENRDIPPLDYPRVHRLRREFPGLTVIINGGLTSLDAALGQLAQVDGVMLGRAAYHNPWLLAEVDERVYGEAPSALTRLQVLDAYLPYVARQLAAGVALPAMSRHLLGLFQGVPGGRRFRRVISERAHWGGAGVEVLREAAAALVVPALRAQAAV